MCISFPELGKGNYVGRNGTGERQASRCKPIGMTRRPALMWRRHPSRFEMILITQADQHGIESARGDSGPFHQFVSVPPILRPFEQRQQSDSRLF
ncbi:hypothetical protein AAW01_00015 [Aurantiacibacter gangjinensis]|uniref:Uncharacterized protein n=1 Tax=Aurantiacibacter gangjinensis TaxID=502682 RepID=A0A0G9MT66_9SPHN|nr:hypothetical protein AAW01_00015 [Aurantiacibacter gangjinensis]